jgi:ribosomal protein S27AE
MRGGPVRRQPATTVQGSDERDIYCPQCGQKDVVQRWQIDQRGQCGRCGWEYIVPKALFASYAGRRMPQPTPMQSTGRRTSPDAAPGPAVIAVVLSICGLCFPPFGVVLGILALIAAARAEQLIRQDGWARGNRLIRAAQVMGVISIVAGFGACGFLGWFVM